MQIKAILIFFSLAPFLAMGQSRAAKADDLFFGKSYDLAIKEYQRASRKESLSGLQIRNLADSYFMTDQYPEAVKGYAQAFEVDSTTLDSYHYNRMLRALSESGNQTEVNDFLSKHPTFAKEEWTRNATFNKEILESENGLGRYTLKNLPINGPLAEFSPAFYQGKILFTSSKGRGNTKQTPGQSYLDIFVGELGPDGSVATASPFQEIPAFDFHKATPYYASSLKKVFYVLSNAEEGALRFDESGKNTLAIGAVDSYGEFDYLLRDIATSFYYPFYDEGPQKLYFAANFEDDGYGGTDLYYVYTNEGQIMSAPVNLGPQINSPGNEIAPFVFEGSLYFASDVYYGLGGMDIYKANFLDGDTFSVPVNLGRQVNSEADDFGLIVKKEGNAYVGYLSSNRPGGQGDDDIYSLVSLEKPGIKTLSFRGQITQLDGDTPVPNTQIGIYDAAGNKVQEYTTGESGEFQIELPWMEQLTLKAKQEDYASYQKSLSGTALVDYQSEPQIISLTAFEDVIDEQEGKTVLKLNKFYFERGQATVTDLVARELDKVVAASKQFPEMRFSIETYTDSRGGSNTNLRLSQHRAEAIREYLLAQGVEASAIVGVHGFGETKILNNCTNGVYCLEMLHMKNNRTLFVVNQ